MIMQAAVRIIRFASKLSLGISVRASRATGLFFSGESFGDIVSYPKSQIVKNVVDGAEASG
ncbi:MAG TPA: hypothetical protein VGG12_00255 [Methylovirgula sp.]